MGKAFRGCGLVTKRSLLAPLLLSMLASGALITTTEGDAHALWKRAETTLWPHGTVPVCYTTTVQSQPNFAAFADVTRTNVENTWSRVANIRFTGWGTCPSAPPAGTLVIDYKKCAFNSSPNYDPGSPKYYYVDFNNSDPGGICGSSDNSTPARWAYFASHEVGHALGFEHEQDRNDNRGRCTSGVDAALQSLPGQDHLGTAFDGSSVMSYCGGAFGSRTDIGTIMPLSAWDIVGVQAAYGTKHEGALVGLGGRCVNIPNSNPNLGSPLIAYDCYGVENDIWTRSWRGGNQTFSSWISGPWPLCIDVPNAAVQTFNTTLQTYACNNSVAQRYTFDQVKWKAIGDQCVVAHSASTSTPLEIQACGTAGYYENWDFEPDGQSGWRARLGGTAMCANVPYGGTWEGNTIALYPCGSPAYPNETFSMVHGGLGYGGKCLSVLGGAPTPGSAVALETCAAYLTPSLPRQRFHLAGPIHGEGGQCLQMGSSFAWSSPVNGASIVNAPCWGNPNQTWEYYFASYTDYY